LCLQEINKRGQKPVDVISHKKKLRDWFEVRAPSFGNTYVSAFKPPAQRGTGIIAVLLACSI